MGSFASAARLVLRAAFLAYGLGLLVGDGWGGHDGAIPGYKTEASAKMGVGTVVVLVNKSAATFAVLPIGITVRDRTFDRGSARRQALGAELAEVVIHVQVAPAEPGRVGHVAKDRVV